MPGALVVVLLHLGAAGLDELIGVLVGALAGLVAIYLATRPERS